MRVLSSLCLKLSSRGFWLWLGSYFLRLYSDWGLLWAIEVASSAKVVDEEEEKDEEEETATRDAYGEANCDAGLLAF